MNTAARVTVFPAVLLLLFFVPGAADAANTLDRDSDPVVLTGDRLPSLNGLAPETIVAFRYEGAWIQIPVQVDERHVVDFGALYDTTTTGITTAVYSDTSTYAGADNDPAFDSNDELVFMAKDAGTRLPGGTPNPTGVVVGTRLELTIANPLNGGEAYVYLFESDGSLVPGAGADYVQYEFDLASGNYKQTYNLWSGPNPENSSATTAYYRTHFIDRWKRDELNVHAGTATGVDILDRHKNLFSPGNCGRSEDTFSAGEGCFATNKDGPVRAVRSYLGANSGPFTQREHLFYERRHDLTTFLRVHAISSVMDYYDYSPDATGLVYYNDLNLDGVTIDGSPDAVTPGQIVWEMVTGAQGTVVIAHEVDTDIPGLAWTSYYSDTDAPIVTQCTGDAYEYGASGVYVDQPIPNTDPYLGAHNRMSSILTVFYESPNQTTVLAAARYEQTNVPLAVSVPTGVAGRMPAPAAPSELFQNHPNPFNAETRIGFRAPASAETSIRVYNVSGRLVATLFEGHPADGLNQVTWNRRDRSGKRVASGIYFCSMQSGCVTATRKMVVLD